MLKEKDASRYFTPPFLCGYIFSVKVEIRSIQPFDSNRKFEKYNQLRFIYNEND